MLLNASVRRLLLNASAGCGAAVILNAGTMQAQTLPSGGASLALLPLNPMSVTVTHDAVQLDAIADTINTQIADVRSQPKEPAGFSLDQLPIVSELVDEKGNFDWGMDLPVSVNVSNFMGAYGVTVEMDFSL